MSTTVEGNKIVIPIEIALEDKQEWKQMIQEFEDVKTKLPVEHQPIPDKPLSETQTTQQQPTTTEESSEPTGNPADDEKAVTQRQLKTLLSKGSSVLSSPLGFGEGQIITLIPEIATLLIAAGFAEQIINIAYAPGGPLDVRFKRDIPNEVFNLFDRTTQQELRQGKIQVIGVASGGFRSLNGANVENTFREIVTGNRSSKIGLQDKSNGWNGV